MRSRAATRTRLGSGNQKLSLAPAIADMLPPASAADGALGPLQRMRRKQPPLKLIMPLDQCFQRAARRLRLFALRDRRPFRIQRGAVSGLDGRPLRHQRVMKAAKHLCTNRPNGGEAGPPRRYLPEATGGSRLSSRTRSSSSSSRTMRRIGTLVQLG